MIPLILTVWLVLSVVTAFVLGKAIRIADERDRPRFPSAGEYKHNLIKVTA